MIHGRRGLGQLTNRGSGAAVVISSPSLPHLNGHSIQELGFVFKNSRALVSPLPRLPGLRPPSPPSSAGRSMRTSSSSRRCLNFIHAPDPPPIDPTDASSSGHLCLPPPDSASGTHLSFVEFLIDRGFFSYWLLLDRSGFLYVLACCLEPGLSVVS